MFIKTFDECTTIHSIVFIFIFQTAMRVFEYLSASEAPDAFAFEYLIKALRYRC